MEPQPPPETIVATAARLFCDGDEHGSDEQGGDGHPRVWLQIGASGFAECPYCDRRFVLAAGVVDRH